MENKFFPAEQIDREVAAMYADFLPKRVFDAHTHMHLGETVPSFAGTGAWLRQAGTPETYAEDMGVFLPGVEVIRLNMMPMLDKAMNDLSNGLRDLANRHCGTQHLAHPENAVSPYVLACDSEETVDALTSAPGVRGIKVYCYSAGVDNNEKLAIGEFLPESAWVVANQKKLPIILHMMRPAALSDPDNFAYINTMARRYPDAQLVLAHCARAFTAWTVVNKVKELEDRGNIWFDLAAVCESGTMMACILKNAGKRVMWGSDYPVCMHRGRAVSVATGSDWLMGEMSVKRTRIAGENLLAFHQAATILDLDQTQIDDIFYNNAARLFFGE